MAIMGHPVKYVNAEGYATIKMLLGVDQPNTDGLWTVEGWNLCTTN